MRTFHLILLFLFLTLTVSGQETGNYAKIDIFSSAATKLQVNYEAQIAGSYAMWMKGGSIYYKNLNSTEGIVSIPSGVNITDIGIPRISEYAIVWQALKENDY